ncbi:MAG: four helix bundle protein [Bacteroidales bacterium]|nr:four helix bundle protein [Bacteroidales bacterium]
MSIENNIIKNKSFDFAARIYKLFQYLVKEKNEFILSKQLLRSGTSIGANVEEAVSSLTKAEFSSKISIAYKESKETLYWLKLFYKIELLDKKEFDSMSFDCEEISKILFSILKTSGRIRNSNK